MQEPSRTMSKPTATFSENRLLFFESIVKHSFDGCVIYDYQNNTFSAVYANKAFYDITGFTFDEIEGDAPFLQSLKMANPEGYKDLVSELKKGNSIRRELLFTKKSGTPFWADVHFIPIKPEEQDSNFFVAILHEITHRKRKEAELNEAIEKAEASKSMKESFLANMSHEIRTPMTGILGMTELLLKTDLTAEQKDQIETIKLSANNLLSIINDILEFKELQSGEFELQENEILLHNQFAQLKKMMGHQAAEKGLTLAVDVDDDVPIRVVGDRARFNQMMLNLLGNAIKFTNDGEILIHAERVKESDDKDVVRVKIADTGIGIPADLLANIFESFNQASAIATYKFGGTGLGLSIVAKIVNQMDGKIHVESEEGKGTSFILEIPFEVLEEADAKSSKSAKSTTGENPLHGIQILVVDDHPINRKIAGGMLGKVGVNINEAESGEEALEAIENNPPDVILMDVHMPGMGGLAATRKIRKSSDPKISPLPIIAITASVLDRDVQECKDAGMDDFIAKPFTYNNLVSTITAVIQENSGQKTTFDKLDEIEKKESERVTNLEMLKEMTGGDSDMMKEMVGVFLDKTPSMIDELVNHHENAEYEKMSRVAHTLKPTFGYVGLEDAQELALKIEEYPDQEYDQKELKKYVSNLKELSDSAVLELQREMEDL